MRIFRTMVFLCIVGMALLIAGGAVADPIEADNQISAVSAGDNVVVADMLAADAKALDAKPTAETARDATVMTCFTGHPAGATAEDVDPNEMSAMRTLRDSVHPSPKPRLLWRNVVVSGEPLHRWIRA